AKKEGLACALRPSRSRKATFCDLNHRCRRDAGLFSLARKATWDRDGRMLSRFWHWLEYDLVALAVLLIGLGSISWRLERQRHDFPPGKLQTMPTSHARGGGDYSDRLRSGSRCLCLYLLWGGR